MSDLDAVRFLASEHDLEFIDLDNYSVDPATVESLPEAVARRHHVLAVKRKFGTPVIAISNPDDVFALDTLRASLGRDFISVVAAPDQIGAYLDRFYGGASAAPAVPEEAGGGELAAPVAEADGGPDDTADEEGADLDDTLGMSLYGSAFAQSDSEDAEQAPAPDDGFSQEPGESANGNGSGLLESQGGEEWVDLMAAPMDADGTDSPDEPVFAPESSSPPVQVPEDEPVFAPESSSPPVQVPEDEPVFAPESASPPEEVPAAEVSGSDPSDLTAGLPPLDAAPPVDADRTAGEPADDDPLAAAVVAAANSVPDEPDEKSEPGTEAGDALGGAAIDLATFAETFEPGGGDDADAASLTAALVDEAVATYEEQHGDAAAPDGLTALPPLARALIDGGRVSKGDMEDVVAEHDRTGQSIARILTARNMVTEGDLMWGMAQEMGLDFVDLDVTGVDLEVASMIPETTARHHNVLVIATEDGKPVVAASNPTDVFAMDDLRTIMGRSFITVVATRSQISTYISRTYHGGGDAADMAAEASLDFDGDGADSVDDIQVVTEEAPIVRYVNLLIVQALNERASDIHVEPTPRELRIRFRIDGVLHDISTAPRSISAAVTTRLKVMADMNIAEHRVPQDGRISLTVGGKGVDLRVATLPTIHGEKVVMRVLDKSSVILGFSDLGFDDDLLQTYEGIYTKPYGTILVTGPTGSGKSTTLYTTLSALNSPEKNIITVEDPVELQIQGINQVQLNTKAGLTFASALKSILRSDPDIVLVGEIRDRETAVIAVEAALTGHLVLATLHTNNAASTPMRLVEMGLEPFMVTSALTAVLAQRLARRLCTNCKEPYEPTEADIVAAGWSLEEVEAAGGVEKLYRAVGCQACSNTGYRGRKALAELMPLSEEIERMIIEGGSVEEIHRCAVENGMVTLRESGLRKAMEGETTLEEVLRVVA